MLVIALACVTATGESGQLTYSRGQNIVAAFEGWERSSDGTTSMVFSYFNRNYEEVLDVPIGPANSIEPGGPDQGQPTHFLPGRHRFVFSVKVPKDWGTTKRLVWTLVVRGKTEKANAFLLPEWEINNQVRAQNGDGSAAGGGNAAEYNEAPKISVGAAQSITLPEAATLTAFVTDDGLPKPRAPRRPPAAAGSGAATAAGAAAAPLEDTPLTDPSPRRPTSWLTPHRRTDRSVTWERAGSRSAPQGRVAGAPGRRESGSASGYTPPDRRTAAPRSCPVRWRAWS